MLTANFQLRYLISAISKQLITFMHIFTMENYYIIIVYKLYLIDYLALAVCFNFYACAHLSCASANWPLRILSLNIIN